MVVSQRTEGSDVPAEHTTSNISTWRKNVKMGGLNPEPWFRHRETWEETDPTDAESEEMPHAPQLLAALQVFSWMYAAGAHQRAWAHLAAEMQAGKSGVINTLIRIVLQNSAKLGIRPSGIFVLTGMSDDAWRKQTRARVPREVRDNVHHNGGLKKVQAQLLKLAAKDGLRNILIIFDESQVASSSGNRPNTLIYKTVRDLAPPSEWVERNIRFLTVSATDPAKVMSMENCEVPCRCVRLRTTKAYQSVESLNKEKRIRSLELFGNIGTPASIAQLQHALTAYDVPLWHILRPAQGKTADAEAKLRAAFPSAQVIVWDAERRSNAAAGGGDGSSESTESLEDINALLSTPPTSHSFVLLKNMFYAAKTLNDANVGVLWDRMSAGAGGDNARLQSLLGRACGYGKSKRTVIYTSIETVDRYLTFWKELCHSATAETLTEDHKATALNRRMPGVVAVTTEMGAAKVAPAKSAANPTGIAKTETVAQKDKEGVEITDVMTLAAAKSWAKEHLTKSAVFVPCDETGTKTGPLTHFKYRGGLRRIQSAEVTRGSNDLAWGQGAKSGSARIMPVTEGYIVVYKPVFRKTA